MQKREFASLDDDVRAMLERQDAEDAPPPWTVPVAELRDGDRTFWMGKPKRHEVAWARDEVAPSDAGGIPVRVYHPGESQPRPLVIFVHGGGFALGDIETYDHAARRLASGASAVVASVDYRLAPEHPFPAAVEDCVQAARWAVSQADAWGADASKVVVVGDSAGGNLAAVVARRFRDEDGPKLVGQGLIYPVTDMRPESRWESRLQKAEGFGLTQQVMDWFGEMYLRHELHAFHPDASPFLVHDLTGLPPALVLTVEHDPLRDEGDAYAARLREAGVAVAHAQVPGTVHGVWTADEGLASTERLWAHTFAWLREVLG